MSQSRPALTILTFSCMALMSTTALSAIKIGVVGAADDSVRVLSAEGKERKVSLGDDIFQDDTVKTDGNGKAQLVFKDRSTITINENSEIKIDKYVYNGSDNDEMGIKSVKGAFRFIGGALSKKKSVNIKTPVATIGIRGGIVDTSINAEGQTDAVFLYGDQMSMTNLAGQTEITTEYGTGFTLNDANMPPVPLPTNLINQQLNNFMHNAGQGGGVVAPPAPSDVDGMMQQTPAFKQMSDNGAPSPNTPTTVKRPKTNVPTPKPIIMVGDNIPVTETMDMTSVMGDNVAQQRLTDRINRADQDAGLLQSLTNNPLPGQSGNKPVEAKSPVAQNITSVDDGLAAPLPKPDNKPRVVNAAVGNTPNPVGNTTNNAQTNNDQTNTPPASPPVEYLTGGFWKLDKNNDGTTFDVILETEQVSVASATADTITLTLQDGGSGVSTVVIPRNITNGSTYDYEENGNISNRIYSQTVSPMGGMKIIKTKDETDNNIQTNFILGHEIAAADMADAITNSVNHSMTNTNAALHSNGVLTYRSVLGVAEETPHFGGLNHNLDTLHVDWNDRSGNVGNSFGGYVGWLEDGTTNSNTHVVFGKVKDEKLQRFKYTSPLSTATTINPLNTQYAALNNKAFFGKDGNPVEGFALDFKTFQDNANATWDAEADFASTATTITNKGVSPLILRDTIDENYAYATSLGVPATAITKKGFAAGTILRSEGVTHKADIYHNTNINDVSISVNNNGTMNGNIRVEYEDETYNVHAVNADFSNGTYLNNKMYAAQQNQVEHIFEQAYTGPEASKAFIVSGNLINNAQGNITAGADYKCDDCKFVTWGVWAGNLNNRTGTEFGNDYANMVPYVVGDVTQNLGTQIGLIGKTGTYKGEAYGQMVNTSGMPKNMVGSVAADLTFTDGGGGTTLNTEVSRLDLNFPTENVNLQLDAIMGVEGTGDATFNGSLVENGGVPLTSGTVNGAVFGTDASEIGGNFNFERNDNSYGGGVFFGKQRNLN